MSNRANADYAEHVAAVIMRGGLGFPDARSTQRSNDGGLDVVATQGVAQVKWQSAKVGRPAVQNLVGAAHNRGGARLFFSGSGYSPQALKYAEQAGVELYSFDLSGRHTAISSAASRRMLWVQQTQWTWHQEAARNDGGLVWKLVHETIRYTQQHWGRIRSQREAQRTQARARLLTLGRGDPGRTHPQSLAHDRRVVTLSRRALTLIGVVLTAYLAVLIALTGLFLAAFPPDGIPRVVALVPIVLAVGLGFVVSLAVADLRSTVVLPDHLEARGSSPGR
ncbi:restriction endonuclease [Gordonia alkaliphila]|uniref:restriction endonuclease n=1 Tax=Gordonia alkaliphila TaxID=1053547 RepID=UPI001FF44830|nr:restriction endonuclease [Gordonia alkaliphila]MCK0441227.1 restriction endonuclease [Gordonia alkaliphila]